MEKFVNFEGLTFDDILILPQYSEISPSKVDVKTSLHEKINLNIPLLSAAMDTVTESEMAIALACQGGIGIIHKNMSPEEQAKEVYKVKRFESGIINNPIVVHPETRLKEVFLIMKENNINGFPVVDKDMKLVGMLTNRDIRYIEDENLEVYKIMTPFEKLIYAYEPINLEEAKNIMNKSKIEKLPIINKDRELKGLVTYKDILKEINYPNASRDSKNRLLVGAAVGVEEDAKRRVPLLLDNECDLIVVDTAHGHTKNVGNTIKWIKKNFECVVVGGNIATYEAALFLKDCGADVVKVGIGPGSICTTRVVAGIGVPQLTAILEVSKALKGSNIKIIADGGIRYSGDIVKAIAAGAHAVMLGNLFAQTEEAPGELIHIGGKRYKIYRGMGSIDAMIKGSKDRYFQDSVENEKLVPEGIVGSVPYRGKAEDLIFQLIGGLKSGMGYIGAKNLEELREKSKFIKITNSALKESHPHDVDIRKEAPNYFLN
ncbi:MAG: IMP dehydrogenase [Spirochaetes bacterium]|nr:IMP dehydrogenase [Spirochaetota bacterium]